MGCWHGPVFFPSLFFVFWNCESGEVRFIPRIEVSIILRLRDRHPMPKHALSQMLKNAPLATLFSETFARRNFHMRKFSQREILPTEGFTQRNRTDELFPKEFLHRKNLISTNCCTKNSNTWKQLYTEIFTHKDQHKKYRNF